MSASLIITQRTIAGVTIVELAGPLLYDDDEERLFRDQIASLVAAGIQHILIDLSQVTHMDSGSVGTLVALHLHTLKRGGAISLLNPSERAARVLHITHLESVFATFATEAEALRVMRGAGHEGDAMRGVGHEGDEGTKGEREEARAQLSRR